MSKQVYKILIADDESLARDSISILLKKVNNCEIVAIATNGQDAFEKILIEQPHIVFMDIQMPYLRGTEVVEKLNIPGSPFFIFVTAFEDHALKAFELNAVDYLLKPFSDERFYQSLNKAKGHVNAHSFANKIEALSQLSAQSNHQPYREQFAIKSPGKIEIIRTDDVLYLKSSGNYIELYTHKQKHLIRMTIGQAEKELNQNEFVRIHRSCIIRKVEIKQLQSYFNGEYVATLRNGTELKVSRSYKDNLEFLTG